MQPGQKVTYRAFDKVERGIVKCEANEDDVFVVYHCADNWERYFDYTAARTHKSDLTLGWLEDAPQNTMHAQQTNGGASLNG